jgi:hypothetical protein
MHSVLASTDPEIAPVTQIFTSVFHHEDLAHLAQNIAVSSTQRVLEALQISA